MASADIALHRDHQERIRRLQWENDRLNLERKIVAAALLLVPVVLLMRGRPKAPPPLPPAEEETQP